MDMHDRYRETIDPSIATVLAGTEDVGFRPSRRNNACTEREAL